MHNTVVLDCNVSKYLISVKKKKNQFLRVFLSLESLWKEETQIQQLRAKTS